MALSELAREIQSILRQRVPGAHPEITYRDLVEALPPLGKPFEGVHWRDPRLDQALADTVYACRAAGLSALSAIVVNAETRRPGRRYYAEAHPGVTGEVEQEVAWARELERVKTTTYPLDLEMAR
jgi:hypothetical protein